jgi:pimeloyl-ACP methyl ester carboxylesterase
MRAARLVAGLVFGTVFGAAPAIAQAPVPSSSAQPAWTDPSPHQVRFVDVAEGVKLEVLDWGGTGRPLVLLAGSGHSAHLFDDVGPKLKDVAHVYGITRRGYGASSQPAGGYDDQRLADDVLAVIEALKLQAPVVAGHSMGGGEITTLGRQHSNRLGGLVYIDALGDPRDFMGADPAWRALLQKLPPSSAPPCPDDRSSFAAARAAWHCREHFWIPEAELRSVQVVNPDGSVGPHKTPRAVHIAIGDGQIARDYSNIRVPVLAFVDYPRLSVDEFRPEDQQPRNADEAAAQLAFNKASRVFMERWSARLVAAVPGARIVNLAGGRHYMLVREADFLRELRAFLSGLPPPGPPSPGAH